MEQRYYYKDNNGNYYSLKEQRSDLIPITRFEYENELKELEEQWKSI